VRFDELRCFFTKKSFVEDVIGVPLNYTINPLTCKIDYISSSMDLLGHSAYASGCRSTLWGDKVLGWLPLYFTEEHFERALPLLEKSMLRLATVVGPPPSSPGVTRTSSAGRGRGNVIVGGGRGGGRGSSTFNSSNRSFVDSSISTLNLTPALILEVLPRLMNTMVVLLADKGTSHAEEALRGYCQLHRLFIGLVQRFPALRAEIRRRLRAFISEPTARSKTACPNLGEFLPLLSVCEEVGWLDIVKPLMEESFARSVLWLLLHVRQLQNCPLPVSMQRLRLGPLI